MIITVFWNLLEFQAIEGDQYILAGLELTCREKKMDIVSFNEHSRINHFTWDNISGRGNVISKENYKQEKIRLRIDGTRANVLKK